MAILPLVGALRGQNVSAACDRAALYMGADRFDEHGRRILPSGAEGKHIHSQPGIAHDQGQNVVSTGRAGDQANHA